MRPKSIIPYPGTPVNKFLEKNPTGLLCLVLSTPLPINTPKENIKIADKSGEILFETSRVRKVLNEFEMLYKINGNSFNVKFYFLNKSGLEYIHSPSP